MRYVRITQATRPRTRHALVLLVFVALSFLLFAAADLHPTSTLIGATSADPSLHVWFMRWLPHAMSAHINPLFSAHVDEPGGVNLMWNTWVPLPALVLTPLTIVGGPVTSFDAAVTLGIALSAWCMYVAADHFVHRTWPAIAAGAAYGFSPFLLDHAYVGHSNLVLAFVPPLMLIALDSILVRQAVSAWRSGRWFGLLMAVQFFISEELLASEAVAVLIGIALLAVLRRRQLANRWRYAVRSFAVALLVFVPLAAYPLWFQFFGPGVPQGSVTGPNFYVTDLLNLVLPTDAQGLEPGFAKAVSQSYAGNSGEWGGYLSLPMLVVVGWAVWHGRRQLLVRVVALTGLALLVLSFGSSLHVAGTDTHIPLPGLILARLPLLEDLLPTRFSLYVALMAALLVAIALAAAPQPRRRRRWLAVSLALLVASYLPPLPFPTRSATSPAFFAVTPRPYPTNAALLVVPFSQDFYSPDAMLWQAQAGMSFRMPEGYIIDTLPSGRAGTGPPPSSTSVVLAAISDGRATSAGVDSDTRGRIAAELHQWGITGVVFVPTGRHDGAVRNFLVRMFGDSYRTELGVTYWPLQTAPSDQQRGG